MRTANSGALTETTAEDSSYGTKNANSKDWLARMIFILFLFFTRYFTSKRWFEPTTRGLGTIN